MLRCLNGAAPAPTRAKMNPPPPRQTPAQPPAPQQPPPDAPESPAQVQAQARARNWQDLWQNALLVAVIALLRCIPYRVRVPLMGWIVARLISPLAGYGARVRKNLALVLPDLPQATVRRLMVQVVNNAGRTVIELFSGAQFKAHVAQTPITGGGLPAVEAAIARGQGVIFVSGHFGNHDVLRAVLAARGHKVAALYLPLHNPLFERHWQAAIASISPPIFPTGRHGLGGLLRHLRAGGMVGLLHDQHISTGADLRYFGRMAKTATSAAELALKYDCLLVPSYGIRQPDGLSFQLVIESPIPPSTPEAMSQALNDSLEAMVRQHLEQWFWVHRRWWPD